MSGEVSPEVQLAQDLFSILDKPKCDAMIAAKTTRQSVERFVYDLDGRKFDRGANVVEKPGEAICDVVCNSRFCHDLQERFTAEGKGYAPYNEVNRQARTFLRENCGKWQLQLKAGKVTGQMPESRLP